MSSKKKNKAKKKEQRNITFLLFAVFIFMTFLVSTVFTDWVKIIENKKETTELNIYYEELLEEQDSLKSEVVKLQDPEYVARYAREKYLYTKDGETILKIVDGRVVVDDKKEDTE